MKVTIVLTENSEKKVCINLNFDPSVGGVSDELRATAEMMLCGAGATKNDIVDRGVEE